MYKFLMKIAWASLIRRRTRTVLAIIMIAASLWGLIFMQGLYEGMYEQMIDNAIRSGSGHITIYAEGYRQEKEIANLIENDDEIAAFLDDDSRVKSFVKRIRQDGLIATARYSRGATILGVDPAAEEQQGRLADYMREGEYSFGKRGGKAVLGSRLAKKLKVKPGNKIILTAQTTKKEVSSIALKVGGIIRTNNMALDETAVFIDTRKARSFLEVQKGVSQMAVMLKNDDETMIKSLQDDLAQTFSGTGIEVFRWDEIYPALMQSRVMMEGFSYVTYLLVFSVAALGIFGVTLVSVLERIREFGMMLAIGTRFAQICRIILFESFFIGFIGFLAGSLAGWATLSYFVAHGLDLTYFSAGLEEFGMDAVMYATIKPVYFSTGFLAVFTATLVSVIFPLRVLKKARPIEAINAT